MDEKVRQEIYSIESMIEYQKHISQDFNDFFNMLIMKWNIIFIGGALREAINKNYSPRDIDIILDDTDLHEFELMLGSSGVQYKKNRFEGYKLFFNNVEVDAWTINRHFAFRNNFYKQSIENIAETTFLNYDSIAFDYLNRKLYKDYYEECMNSRLIEVIGSDEYIKNNPTPSINVARMLVIKNETGFDLSQRAIDYIRRFFIECEENKVAVKEAIRKGHISHYHKEINQYLFYYLDEILK